MKIPPCAVVVDTSCLWNLLGIPRQDGGDTEEQRRKRKDFMKERVRLAFKANASLHVPYVVLFELANGIAHIEEEALRQQITGQFIESVEMWFEDDEPWLITPGGPTMLDRGFLLAMCRKFVHSSKKGVGLGDMAVYLEAERLKARYTADLRHVHIWTFDRSLSGYAPDGKPGCPLGPVI